MDRGRYVRTREAYLALARPSFRGVKAFLRQDLLLIPYTHIILECLDPAAVQGVAA
jgi:hypothetical protein